MITKWEDIPGVKRVYYGSADTIVLVFENDFVVVDAKLGYENEAYPVLADVNDLDALYDAVKADAPGAQVSLDIAKVKSVAKFEVQERARLAYLQKKYGSP